MKSHPYSGIYLVFEGGDGAGKSTQISLLEQRIRNEVPGKKVLVSREPGGTNVSEAIRNILLEKKVDLGEMLPRTEALLFAAARAQFLEEVVRPALKEGTIVLVDRCFLSSYAYQGFGRDLGFDYIRKINEDLVRGISPDLVFWLDIDPEIGLTRRGNTEKLDRLDRENIEFQKKVREGYRILLLKYPELIFRIEASLPVETQAEMIWKEVSSRFLVDEELRREIIPLSHHFGVEF